MPDKPRISICIPAYKRVDFVKVLLESISIQTYRNFEVIVTDDSKDGELKNLCEQFSGGMTIRYLPNDQPLGSPANWNCAIQNATGTWIKLMHDDDWFAGPSSLETFVNVINANPGTDFIFSAYKNIGSNHESSIVRPETFRMRQLERDPVSLLSKNIIGPPSVVIHRNDRHHFYDERMQWLVDMDFYMRYLADTKPVYIDQPLIRIGLNELQVTRSSSLVREVEIPEHFLVLEKTGVQHLSNILVYDAWWRLFRNLGIRTVAEISDSGYTGEIPQALIEIISFQNKLTPGTLKKGFVSKSLMTVSYISSKWKGLLS